MSRFGYPISPSKEGVRRRLFQSPVKPRLFLPTSTNASNNSNAVTLRSKQGMIAFGCFALVVLLGVHLYLFHVLLTSTSENNHHIKGDGAFQPPPQTVSDDKRSAVQQQVAAVHKTWPPPRVLEPLRPIDREQYTIRINTWKRPEQLVVSVDHHASCPGVAQIQVVWCDPDEEPPAELFNFSKVVIEKHDVNNLNERFHILTEDTPTMGILSIDDDVLRPCEAIDSGFFKWTESPGRMVGFDGRLHVENSDGTWQYGYMSTTEKANKYSMSLTRYCFIHRNYMDWYMSDLPAFVLDTVAKNFNCEDIAMSFMISSMTKGQPSLLADFWAIKSMVKLYVQKKISGGHDHKKLRDECVENFAQLMGLKEEPSRLKPAVYFNANSFYGLPNKSTSHPQTERQKDLETLVNSWREQGKEKAQTEIRRLMAKTGYRAFKQGLMEKSDPWKERFGK